MKIMRVKKMLPVIAIAMITITSCKKQLATIGRLPVVNPPVLIPPIKFPIVPKRPLKPGLCVFSYQDVVDVLGSNSVHATAVVLANGVTLYPGGDLNTITYEAAPQTQANSIFNSRLVIEWRWPSGNWQLSTADVWSLGCVYEQAGQPPYTNLIKGG